MGGWRGRDGPRATNASRRTINKYTGLINRNFRELQSHQATIQSLSKYITPSQDTMRNDISFRGSENLRFFTYVTVVSGIISEAMALSN
jgi:hypothetical protein